MKYINNTPIVKDSSELKAPYISMYNQVFVQTDKIKLIISHEIYPVYVGQNETDIIPNESVLYNLIDNKNNLILCCHSLYQALCAFNKLK